MIKVEIVLRTDDKEEAPAIMKTIAEQVAIGLRSVNAPKYYFKVSKTDTVMDIFER